MSAAQPIQCTSARAKTCATLAAVAAMALWCFSGVCYRAGANAIGPMPYLALTTAIGVATILILHIVRRRPVLDLLRLPLRVILAGFFGVAIYSIFLAYALALPDERFLGQVILLNYLWPIWIVLLASLMLHEPVRIPLAIAGAILGFAGLAIARGIDSFTQPPSTYLPHLLALSGAFLWALYSVLLRRWRIPPEKGGSTFHFIVCCLLCICIAAREGSWHSLSRLNLRGALLVLFAGVGPVGLAYYWWEIGVKRGHVHLIALLAYCIPIVSAALIALFFRQALTPFLLPGAAMIVLGAYLAHRAQKRGH